MLIFPAASSNIRFDLKKHPIFHGFFALLMNVSASLPAYQSVMFFRQHLFDLFCSSPFSPCNIFGIQFGIKSLPSLMEPEPLIRILSHCFFDDICHDLSVCPQIIPQILSSHQFNRRFYNYCKFPVFFPYAENRQNRAFTS